MKVMALAVAILAASVGAAGADDTGQRPVVPEPPGYRTGPMHGATPATVAGAEVIDADALAKLKLGPAPVMIDVANLEHKPKDFPDDRIWSPRHLSIPGATWLPGAGSGRADDAFAAAFAQRLATLTGGDKTKPIVTFCHPQRWGSWNAAKRAAALGYTRVYWMPGGAEGWREQHDASAIREDADWLRRLSKLPRDPTGLIRN